MTRPDPFSFSCKRTESHPYRLRTRCISGFHDIYITKEHRDWLNGNRKRTAEENAASAAMFKEMFG